MIQRIQSLYLFLAAVALGLIFFFPLANLSNSQDLIIFNVTGFSKFSVLGENTYLAYNGNQSHFAFAYIDRDWII